MSTVAEHAIKRSVSHDEIVTIAYDSNAASGLSAASEGSVGNEAYQPEGPEVGFPGHPEDA